jgi:hypothetical protein
MSQDEHGDPLLDELDEVRRRIWDACDRDPDKYFAMIQEHHKQLLREGWVEAPPRDAQDKSAA